MPHTYAHPHPAVTADVVVFAAPDRRVSVLLIRRRHPPFADDWALPGGFVGIDEGLDECARRELFEETGTTPVHLEQLQAFGEPDRDPRERVITIAWFALLPADRLEWRAGSDAEDARWFPIDDVPTLAFDHARILAVARRRLADRSAASADLSVLLPAEFTLPEAQAVYEQMCGSAVDRRNFRKWLRARFDLEPTGACRPPGAHRPARLYRFAKQSVQ